MEQPRHYYGVRVGVEPGVYTNYNDVRKQIAGVSCAVYKRFDTEEEAREFVYGTVKVKQALLVRNGYTIFIDSCYNAGVGGLGIVMIDPHGNKITYREQLLGGDNSVNQLFSLYRTLQIVEDNMRKGIIAPKTPIVIYSQSQYLVDTVTVHYPRWTETDIYMTANADKIKECFDKLYNNGILLRWTKGHGNCIFNVEAAKLSALAYSNSGSYYEVDRL